MIQKIIIRNYKGIKSLELNFNEFRTILVGNNGVGKSTIIEALQLALGGDNKVELTLFSFHKSCWNVSNREISNLPKIEIEVYFSKKVDYPDFRGKNNLLTEEHPGLRFTYEFDEAYEELYLKTTHDLCHVNIIILQGIGLVDRLQKQCCCHSNCLSSIHQIHSLIVDQDSSWQDF